MVKLLERETKRKEPLNFAVGKSARQALVAKRVNRQAISVQRRLRRLQRGRIAAQYQRRCAAAQKFTDVLSHATEQRVQALRDVIWKWRYYAPDNDEIMPKPQQGSRKWRRIWIRRERDQAFALRLCRNLLKSVDRPAQVVL